MTAEKVKVVDFGSIGRKLADMNHTARDAFNRHDRTDLDRLTNLQTALNRDIDAAVKKLDGFIALAGPVDKKKFTGWRDVLLRLRQVAQEIVDLKAPILKKIQDSVLFSDKALAQTNTLFDSQAGLLRSILDILHTDNDYLKKLVRDQAKHMEQNCADFATEHESRLIEGLCSPQAAPIFLAILEKFRHMAYEATQMLP
jgi:Na+/phosphate symporter